MMSVRHIVCLLPVLCSVARGEGFLKHDPKRHASFASDGVEFTDALASVMGCTSAKVAGDSSTRLAEVEKRLSPIWRVVPKDGQGRVEWRMMRYMAHRYFLQKSSLLIRGLEPARQVNETNLGTAEILNKKMPSLVETVLEGKSLTTGFSLEDAVALVATMEQLIFDSESSLLETVYKYHRKPMGKELTRAELNSLLESYMVHWMIGDDAQVVDLLLRNRSLLDQELPHWQAIRGYVAGMVKTMEFSRQHAPVPGHGRVTMEHRYSFDEAHEVVGSITNSFASYWETECQTIKKSLVALDKTSTGRIRLADFYGANADGEWRFGESEAYLRELGALDESSKWVGPQVIIPNYLQGASNCIVTTKHYYVCCVNECEPVLNDIEEAVGGPVALPEVILSLVANMSNFDDEPPVLSEALKKQLQGIADTHGGKVPLHGRLFAQWMHYVFPRECPFPHKSGTVSALAPAEFGDFMASTEEVSIHAAGRSNSSWESAATIEEERLMSQWSEEEELIADYSSQLRAPWESKHFFGFGLIVMALIISGAGAAVSLGGPAKTGLSSGFEAKAHFV